MTVPALFPLIMLTALAAGMALSQRRQARLPLTNRQRIAIAIGAFCGGMLGSKLPFALADPRGALCAQAWLGDGKTILFGLAGGYVGVEIAKALVCVTTKTGDSFAIPIAVSIAIGRLGCLAGGCCYGQPTSLPWGIDFGDGIRRHPTQLYEFAFHLLMAASLFVLERWGWFPRQRFKLYLLAYCGYRFTTEFIRPEVPIAFGLTGYQWASIAFVPIIAALWWQDRTERTSIPDTTLGIQPETTSAFASDVSP